jgi:hypothetical protein
MSIRPISEQGTHNQFIPVHATNVSSSGIAFTSQQDLPLNSFYDLQLVMKGCDRIETVIEVVRIVSDDEGEKEYGCRFIGLGKESQFRIEVFRMVQEGNE